MACLRLNFIVPLLRADCNSHYGSRQGQGTRKGYPSLQWHVRRHCRGISCGYLAPTGIRPLPFSGRTCYTAHKVAVKLFAELSRGESSVAIRPLHFFSFVSSIFIEALIRRIVA